MEQIPGWIAAPSPVFDPETGLGSLAPPRRLPDVEEMAVLPLGSADAPQVAEVVPPGIIEEPVAVQPVPRYLTGDPAAVPSMAQILDQLMRQNANRAAP